MLEEELATGFPSAIFPRLLEDEARILDVHDLYAEKPGHSYKYEHRIDIYTEVVAPLVKFAEHGGIGTLFAYGQTGSGKTYTISQIQELVAKTLLDKKMQEVRITIFDLAGNIAYDLLNAQKRFSILEDEFGNTVLAGGTEHTKQQYTVAQHQRSKVMLHPDLTVSSAFASHNPGAFFISSTSLVRKPLEILQNMINVSLSALKDCIRGKAEGKAFIPVRRSMLTKVLKHVFESQGERECETAVIACVNPCLADVGASRNALRYHDAEFQDERPSLYEKKVDHWTILGGIALRQGRFTARAILVREARGGSQE
ncbi:uncharacterized protein MYCFIDRAFT_177884 [Pseudocercospora fijiensis CIRAD86]|uniref:Kinesin motor domain-containing protein n=1 Tax=Pseudocercospora fijiensis (strain CIRAD86) TaxID=383855 RepID=M3AQ96_PSEFD|nr:uncharacterized protein MYCFIDRAFT_177884 [Pseudocercospora fijiensis CIRAD86]EME79253.1 hypothetical protein MYCFIDRAFT_177884 [Pseudocercospora fijiensis CIRAD86]